MNPNCKIHPIQQDNCVLSFSAIMYPRHDGEGQGESPGLLLIMANWMWPLMIPSLNSTIYMFQDKHDQGWKEVCHQWETIPIFQERDLPNTKWGYAGAEYVVGSNDVFTIMEKARDDPKGSSPLSPILILPFCDRYKLLRSMTTPSRSSAMLPLPMS